MIRVRVRGNEGLAELSDSPGTFGVLPIGELSRSYIEQNQRPTAGKPKLNSAIQLSLPKTNVVSLGRNLPMYQSDGHHMTRSSHVHRA